jgi:dihydrodipicolinate synthase/N-acetylneuraminate lyase
MADYPLPPRFAIENLRAGLVIPAHPLALTESRKLDERRQRALTRYYHAAGAGGIAVGVHTTQFEIHLPQHGLYRPVLELAAETLDALEGGDRGAMVRVAGVIGPTAQATREAATARELGYHVVLLSLAALKNASDGELLDHCRAVAEVMPLMGFYLQPAAGGRLLSYNFWRRMAEIPNLMAIKMAPFNRYQTLDVVRAVAMTGRLGEIALYTGNDDHILLDLVSVHELETPRGVARAEIVGGLLGHWACWTRRAVEQFERCRETRHAASVPASLLAEAIRVTDCNAAFFDTAHAFAGCIPGIHEVLRRQGLMATTATLNPADCLSPGQVEEIDRVCRSYPEMNDDEFVREHLDDWLT